MEDDIFQIYWKTYTADMIGTLTERFYRYTGAEDASFPLFTDTVFPEKAKESELTAEEIINHVLEYLRS